MTQTTAELIQLNEQLHQEITERRRVEAALRESQRSLSTLLSNLLGMAYRCRNDRHWTISDARKLRSSAGAVVVISDADDKATWVRAGQVYERLALKMTSLNIKSALLNQPLEVAMLRSQFQRAMELGGKLPQLLVRFGYAAPMPCALRRPVEQVLIQESISGGFL